MTFAPSAPVALNTASVLAGVAPELPISENLTLIEFNVSLALAVILKATTSRIIPPASISLVLLIRFSVKTVTAAEAGNRGARTPAIPTAQRMVVITTKPLKILFFAILRIILVLIFFYKYLNYLIGLLNADEFVKTAIQHKHIAINLVHSFRVHGFVIIKLCSEIF